MNDTAMENISKKLDKVHDVVLMMKSDIETIKSEAVKTNGRINKLEAQSEDNIAKHAVYEERLNNHLGHDEKFEDQTERAIKDILKELKKVSRLVWIGVGLVTILGTLWPLLAEKIFH